MNTSPQWTQSALKTLALAFLLCLAPIAHAGFTNGGFETGDFTGWTIERGYNYGGVNFNDPLSSISLSTASGGVTPVIVTAGVDTDPYVQAFSSAFIGSKMAKINDIDGSYHVTQLSQVGTIDASDLKNGATSATLYINWIGVLVDPLHSNSENPWFNIEITKNGELAYSVTHFSNQPGWTKTGVYGWGESIYSKADQYTLSGLLLNDKVGIKLTVSDCAQGGHGGYAYLDGIGTTQVKPPQGVPDVASTFGLLGLGLAALLGLRRRS